MAVVVPSPKSITHQHVLSIINTELPASTKVRILDVGCGTGHLTRYLDECLPILHPDVSFELYGLDVIDAGFHLEQGFFGSALGAFLAYRPDVPWSDRIRFVSAVDPWPFPNEFFDFVISNQVLEHVQDLIAFFSQTRRILRPEGASFHIFPLKNYLVEGHVGIPFAHRILNHDLASKYIQLMSRFGVGQFSKRHLDQSLLNHFAVGAADSLLYTTKYLTESELLNITKVCQLRASFRYTQEFYVAKLRSLFHLIPRYSYNPARSGVRDWFSIKLLKYVSGITLCLEKKDLRMCQCGAHGTA